jgi:hypothetical protein
MDESDQAPPGRYSRNSKTLDFRQIARGGVGIDAPTGLMGSFAIAVQFHK